MIDILVTAAGSLKCIYSEDMYDLNDRLSRALTNTTGESGYGIFNHYTSNSEITFYRGYQKVRVVLDRFPVNFTTLEALNEEIKHRVKIVNDAFDVKYPPSVPESQQGIAVTVIITEKNAKVICDGLFTNDDRDGQPITISRLLTNTTDETGLGIFNTEIYNGHYFYRGVNRVNVPLKPFVMEGKTSEQIHDDIANRIKLVNDAFDELNKPKVQVCTRYY